METSEPDASAPYDALLAKHLHSVPEARLYVGDDLRQVTWSGVERVFGERLAALAPESILAVYDDSAMGRGTRGFVVTDGHVVYVQKASQGTLALAEVRRVVGIPDGVRVTAGPDGRSTGNIDLRVDEWRALWAVQAWLSSVVSFNRAERGGTSRAITAEQALSRLEHLMQAKRLSPEHRERLVALAARLGSPRKPRRS